MDGRRAAGRTPAEPPPAGVEGARPGGRAPSLDEAGLRGRLAEEAVRYLAAVDAFRREGCSIAWAAEVPA